MFVKRIGNVFKHPNQIVSTDYKCFIAFAPPLISACVVDVASRDLLSLSCLSILKFVRCKNPFPFVSANLSQKTGLTYTHTFTLSYTRIISLSLSLTHTHTQTHKHALSLSHTLSFLFRLFSEMLYRDMIPSNSVCEKEEEEGKTGLRTPSLIRFPCQTTLTTKTTFSTTISTLTHKGSQRKHVRTRSLLSLCGKIFLHLQKCDTLLNKIQLY